MTETRCRKPASQSRRLQDMLRTNQRATASRIKYLVRVGVQYLIDGQLLPAWLQVPRVGLAELFIAEVFLAAIVIH